jgi:hypothetical protein
MAWTAALRVDGRSRGSWWWSRAHAGAWVWPASFAACLLVKLSHTRRDRLLQVHSTRGNVEPLLHTNEGEGHSLAWLIYLIIFHLQIGLLDFLSVVFSGLIYFRIDSHVVQLVSWLNSRADLLWCLVFSYTATGRLPIPRRRPTATRATGRLQAVQPAASTRHC